MPGHSLSGGQAKKTFERVPPRVPLPSCCATPTGRALAAASVRPTLARESPPAVRLTSSRAEDRTATRRPGTTQRLASCVPVTWPRRWVTTSVFGACPRRSTGGGGAPGCCSAPAGMTPPPTMLCRSERAGHRVTLAPGQAHGTRSRRFQARTSGGRG
jgi:hypothetical protein